MDFRSYQTAIEHEKPRPYAGPKLPKSSDFLDKIEVIGSEEASTGV